MEEQAQVPEIEVGRPWSGMQQPGEDAEIRNIHFPEVTYRRSPELRYVVLW